MIVTTYIATLTGEDGRYQGAIHWDKYTPRKLNATISRYVTANELDYPKWEATARFGVEGQARLVKRLRTEAGKLSMRWVDGADTKYAPTS